MEAQNRSADGRIPNRIQPPNHQARVSKSPKEADQCSNRRQDATFTQKQLANAPRRETKRQQRAGFNDALLETKLKQQRHEQQRGDNEEQTEPNEQAAEI